MSNWKKVKLSTICERIGDGLHGTPVYIQNSEICFINGNNLRNGHIIIDADTKKVSDDTYKQHFISLNRNTLLLGINGSIGNMAFYKNEKVMLGKSCAYLNFKSNINKFYYYYFQMLQVRKYFYDNATGSTIKNLSLKSLQDFEVPFPEKSEYENIVRILSALDDKIELNNRINAKLEQMAKTLYDYWFVQFDFPNAEGKPYKSSGGEMVYNEVLKREIPKGWEVKKLSEIANITMGQSPSGESLNEAGNGMIFFQGSTDFGWRYPENRVFTTTPTRLAQENDVLLSVRAPIGALNIAMHNCCIGRGVAALHSKNGFNSYLTYLMNHFQKKFEYLNSVGTTFGSLTKDDLYSLEHVYPETSVLKSFEGKVSVLDLKIKNNIKQNQQLAQLRDWLLPMLMNGQVTVDDAEEMVEDLGMVAEERGEYNKN